MGVLGISEAEFWEMDPVTIAEAIKAKRDYEESAMRSMWERVRWQTAVLLAPHTKGGKVMKLEKLLPLPWDPAPEVTKPEDYEKVLKQLE